MIRQPVQSSNIKSIGHDAHTNKLEVEFHSGRIYEYDDVNADEHRNLLAAKSVGSHFHNFIKSVKVGRSVNA